MDPPPEENGYILENVPRGAEYLWQSMHSIDQSALPQSRLDRV